MKLTENQSFQGLVEVTESELRPILLALRHEIMQIDPNTCEVIRLGEKSATYGVGPKKMKEEYVYLIPYKSWINLGFYQGALLSDPTGLLEGTGKSMRHIKVHSIAEINNTEMKTLIKSSIELRKETLRQLLMNSVGLH